MACSRSRSEAASSPPRLSCSNELAIASSFCWIARSDRSSAFLSNATSTSVSTETRPLAAISKRSLAPTINPIAQTKITTRQTAKKSGEPARKEPDSASRSKRPRSGPGVRSAGCLSVRCAKRAHLGTFEAGTIFTSYASSTSRPARLSPAAAHGRVVGGGEASSTRLAGWRRDSSS